MTQVIIIKNEGDTLVTSTRLVVFAMGTRLLDKTIDAMPPLLQPCTERISEKADLSLFCGDMQPNAAILLHLAYRRPALQTDEIELFADNTKVSKVMARTAPVGGVRG